LRGTVRHFGTSSSDSILLQGLQAYDRGDLQSARELLRAAQATGSWERVRRIYLAGALLELDDAAGAVAMVRDIDLRWVPEPWNSEARWTLALALARSGQPSVADSILAALSREAGPVAERARAQRNALPK
jgi:thioredoxin-like negative regulator of GroEL